MANWLAVLHRLPKSICSLSHSCITSHRDTVRYEGCTFTEMAKRGSNDCGDYNHNGVLKPVRSLICVTKHTSHTCTFRCIYTVNSVSSAWKLDPAGGEIAQTCGTDNSFGGKWARVACLCVRACADLHMCVLAQRRRTQTA